MPSYNKIIISLFAIIFFASCFKQVTFTKEDYLKENIILNVAIDYEFNKQYKNSSDIYEELFNKFHRYEYLKKVLSLNVYIKNYKKVKELSFQNIDKYKKHKEYLMRNYTFASIKLKQYEDSLKMALKLVDINNTANNYSFVADSYYGLKKYELASKYYESSYLKNNDINSLLNMCNILYGKLNKKKEAISYLETYTLNKGCNKKVCATLLKYYQESQNITGMITVSNKLLSRYKSLYTNDEILKIQNYILSLYLSNDIYKAINYLEKEKFDDKKLLQLYSVTNQNKKALDLTRKLYKKTKDLSLLGQIAIYLYETDTTHKYMRNVIANFEKTLKYKSNPIYENYYGYILLNQNKNLKKALKLIQKAYNSNPKNIAYKDSLAYAYYKNKQYKKAYKLMKEVVSKVGTKDKEIKEHWEIIKKYKDKK